MKFCQKCGKELLDTAQFCEACGTPTAEVANNAPVAAVNGEVTVNAPPINDVPFAPVPDNAVPYNGMPVNPMPVNVAPVEVMPGSQQFQPVSVGTAVAVKKPAPVKLIIIIVAAVLVFAIIAGVLIVKSTSTNKYEALLEDAYAAMTVGAELAEDYATLESKVWRNCIYEDSSTETDKYTKNSYGWFYDDFNDALSEFYAGERATYESVQSNVETVNKYMSELKDCPKSLQEEYEAIKALYVAYSDMTDLVVGGSSYSLNSFTEALNTAKSNYKTALSSARMLLE